MNQLTLEWLEAGQVKTQTIGDRFASQLTSQSTYSPTNSPTNSPTSVSTGTFRIGRDPAQCDLVLQHQTVSALHVEILFDPSQHRFFLRNLRDSNPPLVDQERVIEGRVPLRQGSTIQLGLVELRVAAIDVSVSPTVLLSPPPARSAPHPLSSPPALSYGLRCPNCQRISAYTRLTTGCAWCGTSLAAADSVLMQPGS